MRNKLVIGRDSRGYLVTLDMEITEKQATNYSTLKVETMKVLSICGEGRWRPHCDINYGGQIYDTVEAELNKVGTFRKVPKKDIRRILEIWREYHLNDMKAGTDKQVAYIKQLRADGTIGKGWQYDEECLRLKVAGLYEDRGIKWGHGWFCKPLPEELIAEINELFRVH